MRIVLATCKQLPEPDPDEAPLLDALRARGADACSLAWDDPDSDFASADLVLLRATWNYAQQPARFQAWVDAVGQHTALWNPPAIVRWNLHKRYLLELGARGVPHVPTELVMRGRTVSLRVIRERRGFGAVVVKPAIGAGSSGARLFAASDTQEAEAHLANLSAQGDVLVQPYLPAVEARGERSLIWIDGELTHAMRKSPRFSGGVEAVERVDDVSAEERALASAALAAVSGPLFYARVDTIAGDDGQPLLMELELIEPSLFFAASTRALSRFADGALARALST